MAKKKSVKMKNNTLIYIASAVCAVCVIFMIVALCIPKTATKGEFTPPAFDTSAEVGVPEVSPDLGWYTPQAEGLALKVSVCGEVIIKDGKADVYFTNYAENDEWMILRIIDEEGNILAETGIIKPGEYIKTVEFDTVPSDGQTITHKIMAYEPETYYSAGSLTLETYAQIGG